MIRLDAFEKAMFAFGAICLFSLLGYIGYQVIARGPELYQHGIDGDINAAAQWCDDFGDSEGIVYCLSRFNMSITEGER